VSDVRAKYSRAERGKNYREWYSDGTVEARGLRVWRRRRQAEARLRDGLLERGLDPNGWGIGQAV
jgi:hypothetical protein